MSESGIQLVAQPAFGLSEVARQWFQNSGFDDRFSDRLSCKADVESPELTFTPFPDLKTQTLWRSLLQSRRRTPLGHRLQSIRDEFVASGGKLLDWDGIASEVADRRGQLEL